jgi:hypothetical protein
VCVCVCVCVHVCCSVYARLHVCAFICLGVCQHVRLRICPHACVFCLCVCVCVCVTLSYHVRRYAYAEFKSASMLVVFHRARVCSRMYFAVGRTPTGDVSILGRVFTFSRFVCVCVCV